MNTRGSECGQVIRRMLTARTRIHAVYLRGTSRRRRRMKPRALLGDNWHIITRLSGRRSDYLPIISERRTLSLRRTTGNYCALDANYRPLKCRACICQRNFPVGVCVCAHVGSHGSAEVKLRRSPADVNSPNCHTSRTCRPCLPYSLRSFVRSFAREMYIYTFLFKRDPNTAPNARRQTIFLAV